MFKTNTKEEPCNEEKEKGRCVLVYLLRVDKERRQYRGYLENVRDLAAAKQRLVADDTEEISLTDEIKIICGEDAVVLGKPLNRAWYDDNGKLVTVFAGTLMFVRREGRQLIVTHRVIQNPGYALWGRGSRLITRPARELSFPC